MKKISVLAILFAMFLMPAIVKADMIPIALNSYSDEVTTGSTVNYVVKGTVFKGNAASNLDGKFVYDTNYLEYKGIECYDPDFIEGETITPEVKVTKNTNGELEYKLTNEYDLEGTYEVVISFKVKKVPTEGTLDVKFYPVNEDVLYGDKYATIMAYVLGNPIEEDEFTTDDEVITEDENKEVPEKEDKKDTCPENNTNMILVISLIVSIIINIILIISLIIKSKKAKLDVKN